MLREGKKKNIIFTTLILAAIVCFAVFLFLSARNKCGEIMNFKKQSAPAPKEERILTPEEKKEELLEYLRKKDEAMAPEEREREKLEAEKKRQELLEFLNKNE